MEFPSNRTEMWDRSPIANDDGITTSTTITSSDVIPPVYLSAAAIRSLLEEMMTSVDTNFERKAYVEMLSGLGQMDRDFFDHAHSAVKSMLVKHASILRIDDTNGIPRTEEGDLAAAATAALTIPISSRIDTDTELLFPPNITFKLLLNLGKAIRAGRETSLRSMTRIRSAGSARLHPGGRLVGTVRFEMVLPNVSLKFQRIQTIPVLSTSLSLQLARRGAVVTSGSTSPYSPTRASANHSSSSSSSSSFRGNNINSNNPGSSSSSVVPQMGYVTMNTAKKAVPLLETDPTISSVPLIGVWIAFDDEMTTMDSTRTSSSSGSSGSSGNGCPTSGGLSSSIRNPLTWAHCVRYLFNEHIKDRILLGDPSPHDGTDTNTGSNTNTGTTTTTTNNNINNNIINNTFLLINFGMTRMECYEVTHLSSPHLSRSSMTNSGSIHQEAKDGQEMYHRGVPSPVAHYSAIANEFAGSQGKLPPLSTTEDFVCLDFVVDLEADATCG